MKSRIDAAPDFQKRISFKSVAGGARIVSEIL